MGTVDKALGLLGLFSIEEPQWTVEAAASRTGIPTSTAYRYFRSLNEAGLITDFSAGRYVIGPAVIHLDRVARGTDPLVLAAQDAMDNLIKRGPDRSVVILARIFDRRVMCVDQRRKGYHPLTISYERGRPMPLYRGSVSKIILAHLSPRLIVRCFHDDRIDIEEAGLGSDLKSFRRNLRLIRRAGYSVTHGEVDKGVIGIAAPILSPNGDVFACLSLVVAEETTPEGSIEKLVALVRKEALAVTASLGLMSDN